MLVRFTNVGRKSACWDADLPEVTTATLLKEVTRKVKFASRFVYVEYWPDRGCGDVVVGLRTVGSFVVVEEAS
jgi:hypothetical protein